MSILDKMLETCSITGCTPTKNIEKIAKAKTFMFGEEDWKRCPCDGKNAERYCISERCRLEIERDGECHCHCYCSTKK